MTPYRKLSRNPKQFLTVTGMNLHQFQALLPKFTQAFELQEQKRSAGGGSRFAYELPDQMLMLLIYRGRARHPQLENLSHPRAALPEPQEAF